MTDPVTGATQGANACVYCHKTAVNVLPTSNSHALLSRSNTACMNCHQFDMVKQWKNLTNFNHTYLMPGETCSSCHNGTNSLTTKGAAHIATSTDCLTCHNTTAWIPATMVHAATDTNCSSCHNGTQALGKNVTHIPTTDQCSTCHLQSAVAFKPSTFKHGTNTTSCSTCHSGSYTIGGTRVLGKSATHLSTTAQCSTCHSTTAWKPATFVHATTDTNCSSCHNGTLALGKSATTHIPTTAQCSTCHTQGGAFKPATFLHKTGDGYTSCSTCHTGAFTTALNAIRGKPATHVATSAECSTCHTNAAWLPAIYTHAATDTNCSSCHNGTSAMGKNAVTHIPTTAQCSTCHTQGGAFKPSTFTHAAIVTTACNTCHTGAFTTAAGLILGQPAGHISTTAQCSSCHTSQTTWLGATGGAPAFLNLPAPITGRAALTTVAHPDTTSTACTVCHTSGVYKPAFGFDHKGMTKSTAGCIWCHATGQAAITKTGMATGVSFTVKTTGHQGANFSTKDCSSSGCHSGLSVTFPTQNATTKVWSGGKWK